MALNDKKSGFGFDIEERLDGKKGITDTDTPTHTDAYTDIDTDTDMHTDVVVVENKTKRTYGLVKPSVHEKITKYAKANNTSYNDIVCELLEQFIADKGL